tara:strand:+ start:596 stop:880 length:285 start_codon:yes stop_codon:yes gene_type:complete
MIRKKYKKEDKELAVELSKIERKTAVLEIKLIGTSKIKDNLLYECRYVENGRIQEVPIIAYDVTQALAKLEQFTQLGIPENVLKYMLGNERLNG